MADSIDLMNLAPTDRLAAKLDLMRRKAVDVRGFYVGSAIWKALEKKAAKRIETLEPDYLGFAACRFLGIEIRLHDMFEPHWVMPFDSAGNPIEVDDDQ